MNTQVISTTEYVAYGTTERVILNIRIDRHWDGCSIVVNSGHTTLDRHWTKDKEAEFDAYLAFLEKLASAGTPLWAIEEQAGVWTSAAAVVDQAEQDMLDGIAANLVTPPKPVDVSDILADPTESWAAFKQAATRTAAPVTEAMHRVRDSADHTGWIALDGNLRQLLGLSARGLVHLQRGTGRNRRITGARVARVHGSVAA